MSKNNPTAQEQAYVRRHVVLDLIRTKGAGAGLTLKEIQKACAYTSSGAASTLVQSMANDGWITIIRERDPETGRKRNSYEIHEDKITPVPLVKRKSNVAVIQKPLDDTHTPRTLNPERLAVRQLILEYYWNNQNDSLRQFVAWLERDA